MSETRIEQAAPVPERIGPYRIEYELGSGGMGTVYYGTHAETGQVVAVKVLPPSMAREEGFVARFTREIDAMRNVSSPNIVQLYESGEHEGAPYYAMEYVAGETLTDRLHRERRIPWRDVIEISVQICRALKAAHNAGIVHRDLKPSNLLLREDGVVKLTDFGIAQVFASGKLTVTGGILGTAEYMSPEQAQGRRASKQSDIYSLGAVMYVMLTGRPPFVGKTTLEIAQKHKFAQFDSPRSFQSDIPRWLDEVVCKCLSKKPEDRYPDAYVLGLRLQEIPKLVDLSQQDDRYAAAGTGPAEVTLADDATPRRRDMEVGGTFVRDMVRAQVEMEDKPRDLIAMIFDNTWGLITLLLIVVGTAIGLAFWSRPSDDDLFAKGRELMGLPEGTAWENARRNYFTPLLQRNPEKWESEVEPYLRRIELYELKRDLLGKTKVGPTAEPTEPERILRYAHALHEQGKTVEARTLLLALQDLLKGDVNQEIQYQLATELLEQWSQQDRSQRFDVLESALKRAERLEAQKEVDRAREIWRSIVTLYDANPDASDYVTAAKARLTATAPVP